MRWWGAGVEVVIFGFGCGIGGFVGEEGVEVSSAIGLEVCGLKRESVGGANQVKRAVFTLSAAGLNFAFVPGVFRMELVAMRLSV